MAVNFKDKIDDLVNNKLEAEGMNMLDAIRAFSDLYGKAQSARKSVEDRFISAKNDLSEIDWAIAVCGYFIMHKEMPTSNKELYGENDQ